MPHSGSQIRQNVVLCSTIPAIRGAFLRRRYPASLCRVRWIVDGMNVIGSRPDGWWRDRQAAMTALVDSVARWAVTEDVEVTVVFEQPPSTPIESAVGHRDPRSGGRAELRRRRDRPDGLRRPASRPDPGRDLGPRPGRSGPVSRRGRVPSRTPAGSDRPAVTTCKASRCTFDKCNPILRLATAARKTGPDVTDAYYDLDRFRRPRRASGSRRPTTWSAPGRPRCRTPRRCRRCWSARSSAARHVTTPASAGSSSTCWGRCRSPTRCGCVLGSSVRAR